MRSFSLVIPNVWLHSFADAARNGRWPASLT